MGGFETIDARIRQLNAQIDAEQATVQLREKLVRSKADARTDPRGDRAWSVERPNATKRLRELLEQRAALDLRRKWPDRTFVTDVQIVGYVDQEGKTHILGNDAVVGLGDVAVLEGGELIVVERPTKNGSPSRAGRAQAPATARNEVAEKLVRGTSAWRANATRMLFRALDPSTEMRIDGATRSVLVAELPEYRNLIDAVVDLGMSRGPVPPAAAQPTDPKGTAQRSIEDRGARSQIANESVKQGVAAGAPANDAASPVHSEPPKPRIPERPTYEVAGEPPLPDDKRARFENFRYRRYRYFRVQLGIDDPGAPTPDAALSSELRGRLETLNRFLGVQYGYGKEELAWFAYRTANDGNLVMAQGMSTMTQEQNRAVRMVENIERTRALGTVGGTIGWGLGEILQLQPEEKMRLAELGENVGQLTGGHLEAKGRTYHPEPAPRDRVTRIYDPKDERATEPQRTATPQRQPVIRIETDGVGVRDETYQLELAPRAPVPRLYDPKDERATEPRSTPAPRQPIMRIGGDRIGEHDVSDAPLSTRRGLHTDVPETGGRMDFQTSIGPEVVTRIGGPGHEVVVTSRNPDVLIGADKARFRKDVLRILQADPNHPLSPIYDPKTKKFVKVPYQNGTLRDWEQHPEDWQAGHMRSDVADGPDVVVLQTRFRNQEQSRNLERHGDVTKDEVYVIGGIAVDKSSAWDLYRAGRLRLTLKQMLSLPVLKL